MVHRLVSELGWIDPRVELVQVHDTLTVMMHKITHWLSAQMHSRYCRIYLPELDITGNMVGLGRVIKIGPMDNCALSNPTVSNTAHRLRLTSARRVTQSPQRRRFHYVDSC